MNRAYLKYIASLLLFGSNGIVASFIALSSVEIVFSRTLIGGVFLVVIFLFTRKKMVFWHAGVQSLYLVISGAAMGASWIFVFEAYRQIGVSVATLAYYCGPILVVIAAIFLFREQLTVLKVGGLLAVVVGMVCVNGLDVFESGPSWGLVCGLMAALMYAVMVIFNKKAPKITGLENSMCQLIVGCIVVGVFMAFTQREMTPIAIDGIAPILFLGVVNTGLGCYLYFSSIQKLSAQTVSICGYLEPLSALVLSAAILGERLSLIQIIGAVLIFGGIALGELLGNRRKASESKRIDAQ